MIRQRFRIVLITLSFFGSKRAFNYRVARLARFEFPDDPQQRFPSANVRKKPVSRQACQGIRPALIWLMFSSSVTSINWALSPSSSNSSAPVPVIQACAPNAQTSS